MNDQIINIGTEKQVFLDGFLVDSKHNIGRRMHTPRRDGEILIAPDRRWDRDPEGRGESIGSYSSVLKEDGKIRIWYDSRRAENLRVAYAESEDGIHFKKPEIGLHEIEGSKANNIVIPGPKVAGAAVWKDPNAPPEHRYKTQTKVYPSGDLQMHSSPDGIRWSLYATPEIGDKDTQSIVFWDRDEGRYLIYTRKWVESDEDQSCRFRTVRRLESDDLEEWEEEQIIMAPDERDWSTHEPGESSPPVDFYGAAVFPYHGVYIMLLQTFWHWVDWEKEGSGPSAIDVQLAVSRDGKEFKRLGGRRPFMGLGPEGRFDSRFVWAMPRPVRMGDELWIYYVGSNREHGPSGDLDTTAGEELSGIGRAVLRLDGFVSVSGGIDGGWFTTPPLRFRGDRLELNADAAGGGSVEVEMMDPDGHPIQGLSREEAVPVTYNSVHLPVEWKGDRKLGSLAGQPVRVRFYLTNADLYAFQFRD